MYNKLDEKKDLCNDFIIVHDWNAFRYNLAN